MSEIQHWKKKSNKICQLTVWWEMHIDKKGKRAYTEDIMQESSDLIHDMKPYVRSHMFRLRKYIIVRRSLDVKYYLAWKRTHNFVDADFTYDATNFHWAFISSAHSSWNWPVAVTGFSNSGFSLRFASPVFPSINCHTECQSVLIPTHLSLYSA